MPSFAPSTPAEVLLVIGIVVMAGVIALLWRALQAAEARNMQLACQIADTHREARGELLEMQRRSQEAAIVLAQGLQANATATDRMREAVRGRSPSLDGK